MLAISEGRITGVAAIAWLVAFAAFGLAFSTICFRPSPSVARERMLVLVQSIAAAVMVLVSRDGLAGATFVVAAAQVVELVPPRVAAAWVAVQTAVIAARYWWLDGWVTSLTIGGGYLGFQMFAMTTASLAFRERTRGMR